MKDVVYILYEESNGTVGCYTDVEKAVVDFLALAESPGGAKEGIEVDYDEEHNLRSMEADGLILYRETLNECWLLTGEG